MDNLEDKNVWILATGVFLIAAAPNYAPGFKAGDY